MKKRIISGTIALALASSLLFVPPAVYQAEAASFKDTQNHWAGQVVDQSYALDLIKGYPGGIFKPEDPVSRLEAIAIIIRGMGLEKEALALDYKNSGVTLPKGMTWGQGHLVLATQKGLLDKNYVSQLMYNNPITRQEVAALVAVALHDKLKVTGDPQKLSFTDTDKISTTYLPYVADVSQNDIMQGQGDNTFGPNDIMKRGQMAALMAKTVLNGWFDYGSDKIIRGTLNGIDAKTGIATITKSDGTQLPRLVSTTTVYYRGSAESSRDQFKAGEKVLAIVGSDATIRYMETSTGTGSTGSSGNTGGTGNTGSTDTSTIATTETVLTGKIIDRQLTGISTLKIRDIGYQDQTYPLSAGVAITDGTSTRDLTSLTNGQYVTVKVKNNQIYSVQLLQSIYTEGVITGIYSDHFTIKPDSGSEESLNVKESEIKIMDGNSQLPFASLKIGDRVKATSVSGEAREIVRNNTNISGDVRGVDTTYYYINIRDNNGNRKEYEIEMGALITKNGDRVSLSSINQGDKVNIKVDSDGNVSAITVTGQEVRSISGTVTNLRTGSAPRIYIDSNGYDISSNASITENGNSMQLADVMIGASATVKLDADNMVIGIEITDNENVPVEGTIESINDSTNRITITQTNGLDFTLKANSGYTITDQTSYPATLRYLDDLRIGWDVRLYLNNGYVTNIKVISR